MAEKEIMVTRSSGNIFADLDIPDAEYEKLCSGLLACVGKRVSLTVTDKVA